jgi:hypothetical protein
LPDPFLGHLQLAFCMNEGFIHLGTFPSSSIGRRLFPIPLSSTCTEDLTPVNRPILVAGRLPVTNLATLL